MNYSVCHVKQPHWTFIALRIAVVVLCTHCSFSLGNRCSIQCKDISIQYPFGIEDGCGASVDYRLLCVNNEMLQLNLTTSSSSFYNISNIDYDDGTIFLQDFAAQSPSCENLRTHHNIYSLSDSFVACGSAYKNSPTFICAPFKNYSSCAVEILNDCNLSNSRRHCCANMVSSTTDNIITCGLYEIDQNNANDISSTTLATDLDSVLTIGVNYLKPQNQSNCAACQKMKGFCGFSSNGSFVCRQCQINADLPIQCTEFNLACTDGSCANKSHNAPLITGVIFVGVSIGGAAGSLGLIGIFLFCKRRNTRQNNKIDVIGFNPPSQKDEDFMQKLNSKETTLFSYKELVTATDSFSQNMRLGAGGSGTVYKGTLSDGQIIAVKKLNQWNKQGLSQLYNEVTILSKVRHRNLVRLLGCCLEEREVLVVYEFVSNGTLADQLHAGDRRKDLNWATRLKISLETARALAYLHESVSPPIFHRDVKSTNILLDAGFHTKVGDFGLSRFIPLEATHVSTAPQGTPGYLDPDYYESYRLTDKSDVYSLGVVLMEMISAKRAVDMSRDKKEINLASLAISKIQCGALQELVDPNLDIESNPEVKHAVTSVAELAFCCLAPEKDDRPCMKVVAEKLENILQQTSYYTAFYVSPPQEISLNSREFSETRLLIKPSATDSPVSVMEPKWLSPSTDSSNNSQGGF